MNNTLPKLFNAAMLLSLSFFICIVALPVTAVAQVAWTDGAQAPPITPGTAAWVTCPVALPINPPELGGQYGITYDNTVQQFYIYIPNNFDPNKTYGVESMIWGSTIQEDWKPIFDARDIIYVTPSGADNSQAVGHRVARAITAANLIKKYYKVDTNRVYVGGHSGGAATALGWACYDFPLFWKGAIVGCQFYYRNSGFDPAAKNMKRAVIEPLNDTNRDLWAAANYWNDDGSAASPVGTGTKTGYDLYATNGYAIRMWRPAGGHIPPPAPELRAALTWLDGLPDGTNYPAVALSQSVNIALNTAKAITVVATDEAGEALTYIITTPPSNGTLTGTGPVFTYTPNTNYTGADSFAFKANDGTSDSNVATVTINVRANAIPVASTLTASTAQNNSKSITLKATDANSDPLTYSIVTAPTNGTLTGTPPNITYVPTTNYNGTDSFTYKANDSYVDSNVATVNLTVTFVNQAPVANNLTVLASQNTPTPLRLTATDVDSYYLTYAVVTPPANGTLSGYPPNVTYTPNSGYTGADSFTFRAYDGTTYSSNATVSITVSTAVNATLIDHTFNEGTGTLNGTLVDAGTLKTATPSLAWVTDPGTIFTANGAIASTSATTTKQSAYVPLGTAIANGAIYELTVTLAKPSSGVFVTAGFFDSATPTVTNSNMDGGGGTAWFLWRTGGSVEVNRGLNYDTAGNGYATTGAGTARSNGNVTASTQTFTIKLDLSAANGTTNFGCMTVYAGDSATGTVMGGLSNVPFTSAQHLRTVGFSTWGGTGSITNFNLTRLPPAYTGTSATVAIAATIATATRLNAVNGEFTLTRSGYTGGALDVTLAIAGTAANGTDYETIPTTVTFPAGQATITMPVLPLPYAGIAPPVSVVATITPTGTYSVASTPANTATVAILDGTMETLTVNSAHGTPTPSGTSSMYYGSAVTASVNSPVTENSTIYVATGWTGTGSVGSGTGSSASFTLTSNSTLTWQWASAGSNPWSGNSSVDSNWATATNWGGSFSPGAGDPLTFVGTTRATSINNLAADTSFGAINFVNTTTGQAFSLSGNRITLAGDIWLTAANGTINDSSSIPMILSGNRMITTDNNHNLTLSGILSGTGGLIKAGSSTLTLNGTVGSSSNFTGDVNINAGTLSIQGSYIYNTNPTSSALGNLMVARNININAGATLTNNNGNNVDPYGELGTSMAAVFNINGGTLINSTGFSTLKNVTMNGGTMQANGGNVEINFYFNGGTVTVNGAGASIMTSTGTNGYGLKDVIFNVDPNNTGASLIVSGNLWGAGDYSGNGIITKTGSGTMLLSGTNKNAGAMTITAGTLQFAKMASLYNNTPANWTAAKINVKSGATLALNVDSAATAGFDSTNLNTLLANISVAGSATSGLQSGASIGLDTSTAAGGTFTQGNIITNSTGANGGAISLTKLGTGTLILDKSNTYTGSTSVKAGILSLNNACLADAADVALTTGAVLNLNFSGTDTVGKLIIGGVEQYQGIWGGQASSALHKTAAITGTGLLNVTAGPVAPTPSITTAPTASAIIYGQTLASSTLSGGAASVPGTFAWTTPGTLPALGTTAQAVTFTPTDLANYSVANLSVNVTVNPAGFDGWASGYGLTGAAALATADPDGDGIPNLVEYALGLNPTVAHANPVQMSRVTMNGSTYLQLSVNRNPAVTNVLIEGLSAGSLTDPAAWSTGTTVIEDNTATLFRVRDSLPIETNSKRFLRLRFTLQP